MDAVRRMIELFTQASRLEEETEKAFSELLGGECSISWYNGTISLWVYFKDQSQRVSPEHKAILKSYGIQWLDINYDLQKEKL